MAQLDKLLYRFNQINVGGVPVAVPQPTPTQSSPTPPTILNLASGLAAAYNPSTNAIDISAFATATVSGQNPLTLSNGLNSNIATGNQPSVRLAGPTGAFSVGGLALNGGAAPSPGQAVDVINTTSQLMTIVHEDASSTAMYRISTGNGVPYPLPPYAKARFVYDGSVSRWALKDIGALYPTKINVKDYGATGNGTTNDTTAIQAAIAAFQTAAASSVAAELFFPAGTYLISSQLTITGVTGGKVRGAGITQTIIKESPTALEGAIGMIVLTNCRYTTVSDMTFAPQPDYDTLSGSSAAGTTAINITIAWAEPLVGQRAAIVSQDFTKCDVVTIVSAVGTAITFTPPTVNAYSNGDYLAIGVLAGATSYSDQTLSSPQTPTGNKFERLQVTNASVMTAMAGVAVACKGGGPVQISLPCSAGNSSFTVENAGQMYVGEVLAIYDTAFSSLESVTISSFSGALNNVVHITGTLAFNHAAGSFVGSPSDVNNDEHIISDCVFTNPAVAGLYIEGQNALHISWKHGSVGGDTYAGVWAQYGGSVDTVGVGMSVLGWAYTFGGLQQHPNTLVSGANEGPPSGSTFGVLYIPLARNAANPYVRFIGLDQKFGSTTANNLFNVTASGMSIELHGCRLDGTSWNLHDVGGGGLISVHGCQLTRSGGLGVAITLWNVNLLETGTSHYASPSMAQSGSATVSFVNRYLYGTNVASTGFSNSMGFYGTSPIAKPTVSGSKSGNPAITSIMAALSNLGLVTDSTT